LRIDGRKAGQERCVPLPEMVLRCLEAYLPLRHNQLEQSGLIGETALLLSRNGQRVSGGAISNGIHDIASLAQVKTGGPNDIKNQRGIALRIQPTLMLEISASVLPAHMALGFANLLPDLLKP